MILADENKQLWLYLCAQGGLWTTRELAERLGRSPDDVSRKLHKMAASGLVASEPAQPGRRGNRYSVTGTCYVPYGVRVAEAQA